MTGPNVADLFCGAGGLSIGLGRAGFNVTVGAEWDGDACETFAKAHPTADVWHGDISQMGFSKLRGVVDVVVGGPPCQPWSNGGKRLGAADPRDGWPSFLRALRAIRPNGFLAENVAGFAGRAGRSALRALRAELSDLGFAVTAAVVNAADHGVPQRRRRLLIIGTRNTPFTFPPSQPNSPVAGDVIGPEPFGTPNRSIVTYARLPDLRPNPYDGHVYNGGGRPVDLTQPAPTLLASMGGNKTPWVDTGAIVMDYHAHLRAGGAPRAGPVPGARRITTAEAARLQTFPDDMAFSGRQSSVYRQIGNAVPPQLAFIIGQALIGALNGQ